MKTPFCNQTSPDNLIEASMGVIDCVLTELGATDLKWKAGIGARLEVFKLGTHISSCSLIPIESSMADEGKFTFCGRMASTQGREFPLRRLELHSDERGHVGTVDIV